MATHERALSHRAASSSHVASIRIARSLPGRPVASAPCVAPARHARHHAILTRATAGSDADGIAAQGPSSVLYAQTASSSVDEGLVLTKFIAETLLPTRHGKFRLRGYKHSIDGGVTFTEPTAIVAGVVEGGENIAVRVHDACFTSEVLGSLKCDCAEQLELALRLIQGEPPGVVIYLQQEGRGIGLANKIAAYSLQEQGLDTVDANRALGLPDDCREYTSVRNMLAEMGIRSVRLITNNPRKMSVLTKLGIKVTGRIPCLVAAGAYNQDYLDAKRDRMAHMLPEEAAAAAAAVATVGPAAVYPGTVDESQLNGDFCFWDHDGEPTQAVATVYAKGGMDLPAGLAHGDDGRVVPVPLGAASPGASLDGGSAAQGNGSA